MPPFEHLGRQQRRAAMRYAVEQNKKRPPVLTEVPRAKWPPRMLIEPPVPVCVWESREFLVQAFQEGVRHGSLCVRLSCNRTTLGPDGRWEDGLSWEDLMRIKRECGYGEHYAVEVCPADSRIVNVANLRHLWILTPPLDVSF
jgi:hypothetical protein